MDPNTELPKLGITALNALQFAAHYRASAEQNELDKRYASQMEALNVLDNDVSRLLQGDSNQGLEITYHSVFSPDQIAAVLTWVQNDGQFENDRGNLNAHEQTDDQFLFSGTNRYSRSFSYKDGQDSRRKDILIEVFYGFPGADYPKSFTEPVKITISRTS